MPKGAGLHELSHPALPATSPTALGSFAREAFLARIGEAAAILRTLSLAASSVELVTNSPNASCSLENFVPGQVLSIA
jgi:hypothetical protein